MKKYRYLYIMSLGSLLTVTIGLLYLYYLLFFPVKDVAFNVPPTGAEVLNEQPLKGGDNVFYGLTFCNYTKPRMDVIYTLISPENKYKSFIVITRPPHASANSFEESNSGAFQPCSYMIDGSVELPDNIPDGTYIIGVNIISHVNHLRNQTYFFETEPFEVISKGGVVNE